MMPMDHSKCRARAQPSLPRKPNFFKKGAYTWFRSLAFYPTVLPEVGQPFPASVTTKYALVSRHEIAVCVACLPGGPPGKWSQTWSGLRGFLVLSVASEREHPRQATPAPCRISVDLSGMHRSSSVCSWLGNPINRKSFSLEHQPRVLITLRRSE